MPATACPSQLPSPAGQTGNGRAALQLLPRWPLSNWAAAFRLCPACRCCTMLLPLATCRCCSHPCSCQITIMGGCLGVGNTGPGERRMNRRGAASIWLYATAAASARTARRRVGALLVAAVDGPHWPVCKRRPCPQRSQLACLFLCRCCSARIQHSDRPRSSAAGVRERRPADHGASRGGWVGMVFFVFSGFSFFSFFRFLPLGYGCDCPLN